MFFASRLPAHSSVRIRSAIGAAAAGDLAGYRTLRPTQHAKMLCKWGHASLP
jgi:hypothetical protein